MRVAAISDIHGNLPALEAVLADIEREGVDQIVVAGDTVSGPWPAEVFDLLDAAGARFVHGNADRTEEVERFSAEQASWNVERLGSNRIAEVVAWPLTLELEVDGLGASSYVTRRRSRTRRSTRGSRRTKSWSRYLG